MSAEKAVVGVYRDLTNRFRGESDDGPLARAAHQKRMKALQEDFSDPSLTVADWGQTKDQNPHEYVELVIEFLSSPLVHATGSTALTFIGGVLSGACSSVVSDGLKSIFSKLVHRIKSNDIQDFNMSIPGKATIIIHHDFKGTIVINGETKTFQADI